MADGTTALGNPGGIASGDRLSEVIWASEAHVETQKTLFFSQAGMVAKDRGNEPTHERRPGLPIVIKDDFKKGPGEEIRIRMRMQLTRLASNKNNSASSLTRDTTSMLGNEEAIAYRDLQVYLALLKNSVGFDSPDWLFHRTSADLEEDAKDLLRDWLVENHEDAIFDAFHDKFPYFVSQTLSLTTVAHPSLYYANEHSAADDMTTTDTFSEHEIRRIWSFCQTKKLNPVMIDGKKCFVVLCSPFVLTDLLGDAQFRDLVKDAHDRGSDNPLVKGSQFKHLDLYFYGCDRVRQTNTGAFSNELSRMPILGADSIAVGYGSEPRLVPRVETNYGDRWGMAIRQVFGATRCDYRNQAASATLNQSSAEWVVYSRRPSFATTP